MYLYIVQQEGTHEKICYKLFRFYMRGSHALRNCVCIGENNRL